MIQKLFKFFPFVYRGNMRFDNNYTGQSTPDRAVYKGAVTGLVDRFRGVREDRLGFILFGRIFNEGFRPESKLDRTMKLVFVYPDDVVIRKDRMRRLSDVLAGTFENSEFPIDVFVGDAVTIADGRFCFVDSQEMLRELRFGHYFGARYGDLFKYIQPNKPQQVLRAALNRGRETMALFDLYANKDEWYTLLKAYRGILDIASRFPSMIVGMGDGMITEFVDDNVVAEPVDDKMITEFVDDKVVAKPVEALRIMFPEQAPFQASIDDLERLIMMRDTSLEVPGFGTRDLKRIREDEVTKWEMPKYFGAVNGLLRRRRESLRDGLYSAVDFMEGMVREYIKQQPQPSI